MRRKLAKSSGTASHFRPWKAASDDTRDRAGHSGAAATAALDEAQRRADAARYQEVTCRSALNPVKGMPFNWTLNPYRGCTHACHYCFARRYQTQFELGADDHFSSVIFVKTNLVDVLRRELDKPSWTREQVALRHRDRSVSADRRALQADAAIARSAARSQHAGRHSSPKARWSSATPTCSQNWDARAGCTVYMSVPTVDEDAWRALEPGTAHPLQRLAGRATAARCRRQRRGADGAGGARVHHAAGTLEATIKAIADHGAAFIGANVLYLKGGTKDHFMGFLSSNSRIWSTLTAGSMPAHTRRSRVREDGARDDRCAAAQIRHSRTAIAKRGERPGRRNTANGTRKGRS